MQECVYVYTLFYDVTIYGAINYLIPFQIRVDLKTIITVLDLDFQLYFRKRSVSVVIHRPPNGIILYNIGPWAIFKLMGHLICNRLSIVIYFMVVYFVL